MHVLALIDRLVTSTSHLAYLAQDQQLVWENCRSFPWPVYWMLLQQAEVQDWQRVRLEVVGDRSLLISLYLQTRQKKNIEVANVTFI